MIVKEPHALPIFIALTYHKHKKVQFMCFFLSPLGNFSFSEMFLINHPRNPQNPEINLNHFSQEFLFQGSGSHSTFF